MSVPNFVSGLRGEGGGTAEGIGAGGVESDELADQGLVSGYGEGAGGAVGEVGPASGAVVRHLPLIGEGDGAVGIADGAGVGRQGAAFFCRAVDGEGASGLVLDVGDRSRGG